MSSNTRGYYTEEKMHEEEISCTRKSTSARVRHNENHVMYEAPRRHFRLMHGDTVKGRATHYEDIMVGRPDTYVHGC